MDIDECDVVHGLRGLERQRTDQRLRLDRQPDQQSILCLVLLRARRHRIANGDSHGLGGRSHGDFKRQPDIDLLGQ